MMSTSATGSAPSGPFIDRRVRDRRRLTRRGCDRERTNERRGMVVILYLAVAAVAAAAFGIGMWVGWFAWGGS